MRSTLLKTVLIVVASTLFAPTGQRPLMAQVETPLLPGDMVRLQIWRDPGLNGDYPVDEKGMVSLPLIGLRQATNISAEQLRQGIIDDLSKELRNQDPVVTLLRRVRVLGEVQSPGLYHVDPTMTLADVVALAAGATPNGKLNEIRIVRRGVQILSDLDATVPVAQTIQSGDQIMVPKDSWLNRNGRLLLGGMISASAIVAAALIR